MNDNESNLSDISSSFTSVSLRHEIKSMPLAKADALVHTSAVDFLRKDLDGFVGSHKKKLQETSSPGLEIVGEACALAAERCKSSVEETEGKKIYSTSSKYVAATTNSVEALESTYDNFAVISAATEGLDKSANEFESLLKEADGTF